MTLGLSLARLLQLSSAASLGAALLSCSDPVPPSAQGNFSMVIANNADPAFAPSGTSCKAGSLQAGAGTPRPTEFAPGGRLSDGDDRASVSCTVRKSGELFSVTGRVIQGATSFYVKTDDLDPTTRIGSGVVSVASGGQNYESGADPICTVEVIQTRGGDGTMESQIKPGAVWAKFSCPSLEGGQLNDYCRGNGVFVLENCEE